MIFDAKTFLHDLMDVLNKSNQKEHHPMINSRYSVVIAAAKRARQLIDGSKSPIADEIKNPYLQLFKNYMKDMFR